jgi:adenine deaminase
VNKMRDKRLILIFCVMMCLSFAAFLPGAQKDRPPYAIKAGKILTITKGVIQNGVVLVKDGKIEKVGKDITIPAGYTVVDASEDWLLPGMVDIHSIRACAYWIPSL